jgi:hypothetical protein
MARPREVQYLCLRRGHEHPLWRPLASREKGKPLAPSRARILSVTPVSVDCLLYSYMYLWYTSSQSESEFGPLVYMYVCPKFGHLLDLGLTCIL